MATGNETAKNRINSRLVCDLAAHCGFDAAGIAPIRPVPDFYRYRDWVDRGLAGEMKYLTDHRADIRGEPERLLAGVKSAICLGSICNYPVPASTEFSDSERGWIARYAWAEDYHKTLRAKLEALACKLLEYERFEWRACVDTAPLPERSLAREAGLGWIGKNTCLINQKLGSWLLLGELLTTLELEPDGQPADRCGSCTRCIDACPTDAIVPSPQGRYELDARLCISYFTIELRAAIPEEQRRQVGHNIFGCDICQDVCPWNRRAPVTAHVPPHSGAISPPLERMAELTQEEFRELFRETPVSRAKYNGFLRNVAVAMGNSGLAKFRAPLLRLVERGDELVAEHARWALGRLNAVATE